MGVMLRNLLKVIQRKIIKIRKSPVKNPQSLVLRWTLVNIKKLWLFQKDPKILTYQLNPVEGKNMKKKIGRNIDPVKTEIQTGTIRKVHIGNVGLGIGHPSLSPQA